MSTGGPHSQAVEGQWVQAAGRTHAAPTPEETSIAAPPALQDGPSLVTFLVGLFALGAGHVSGGAVSWWTLVDTCAQLNPRTGLILLFMGARWQLMCLERRPGPSVSRCSPAGGPWAHFSELQVRRSVVEAPRPADFPVSPSVLRDGCTHHPAAAAGREPFEGLV